MTVVIDAASIPFSRVEIGEEARAAVLRVLDSGWVTTGTEVLEFEREFARLTGTEQAVAVSSCTAALEIALRGLGLRRGARVLVPTITFCGAAHAIVHAGLEPVLVDVDSDTLMPTVATVRDAVRRAGGVDAMMILHFAGHPAPVHELAAAADLPLSRVVEDAAHALGTWVGAEPVGGISAATCFSFYATKNLPIGEGGMITTRDEGLASYARAIRLHGMSHDAWRRYLPGAGWRYSVDFDGLKANMTDVQAAIGRAQLRLFAKWQARREQIACRYSESLQGVDELHLPAHPITGRHAWHLYVVQIDGPTGVRDHVIQLLQRMGIECSVHFIPLHHHAYFRQLLSPMIGPLPGADRAAARILSLPLYPSLSDAQIDRVCAGLREVLPIVLQMPARAGVV